MCLLILVYIQQNSSNSVFLYNFQVKDIRDKTFTDIMRYYRNQSQAASHIYRDVLIQPALKNENGNNQNNFKLPQMH